MAVFVENRGQTCAVAILVGRGLRSGSRTICCADSYGEACTSVCPECIKILPCQTPAAGRTSLSNVPLLRLRHCYPKQAIHSQSLRRLCNTYGTPARSLHASTSNLDYIFLRLKRDGPHQNTIGMHQAYSLREEGRVSGGLACSCLRAQAHALSAKNLG